MTTLSYHHTSRLTNLAAERLGQMLVGHRPGGLSHAVFLSSGSEANESAIKLARQYYVERGEPERVHIISRNNSYHGNSIGCVSLTGIPVSRIKFSGANNQSRRRHFEPILMQHTSRVSPCYPYRYKRDAESDEDYSQRLGDELEEEVLRVGADKVAAFFAETGRSQSSSLS
jgi:adenosylmethionine-8-amino-7-oxononanoate aminotransferase